MKSNYRVRLKWASMCGLMMSAFPIFTVADAGVEDYLNHSQVSGGLNSEIDYSATSDWGNGSQVNSTINNVSVNSTQNSSADFEISGALKGMQAGVAIGNSGSMYSARELFACNVKLCVSTNYPPVQCKDYLIAYEQATPSERERLIAACPNARSGSSSPSSEQNFCAVDDWMNYPMMNEKLTLGEQFKQSAGELWTGFSFVPRAIYEDVKESYLTSSAAYETMREADNNGLYSGFISVATFVGDVSGMMNVVETAGSQKLAVDSQTGLIAFDNFDNNWERYGINLIEPALNLIGGVGGKILSGAEGKVATSVLTKVDEVVPGNLKAVDESLSLLTKNVDDLSPAQLKQLADEILNGKVWKLDPKERGKLVEKYLANTEYKTWGNIGQLNDGYFPYVDFMNGKTVVSLKTVDTTGKTWMKNMEEHIIELAKSGITVSDDAAGYSDELADLFLDIRVQPGGFRDAQALIKFGEENNVTVLVKEFN